MKPLASYSVGPRLRLAREKRKFSMQELANKAEVAASTINHIEKGEKQPRGDTIERLAIALGVDPCWLLYGTGSKPKWNDNAEHAD